MKSTRLSLLGAVVTSLTLFISGGCGERNEGEAGPITGQPPPATLPDGTARASTPEQAYQQHYQQQQQGQAGYGADYPGAR